jgi:hypothetical protein
MIGVLAFVTAFENHQPVTEADYRTKAETIYVARHIAMPPVVCRKFSSSSFLQVLWVALQ